MKKNPTIRPKDMTPEQRREHVLALNRIRNRRHYTKIKNRQMKNGAFQIRRWRVVYYDENGKVKSLRIRKGTFLITFD